MKSRINEFLKCPEYLAWQKSFWELCFSDRPINDELIREFETKHLISSIKQASNYPKDAVISRFIQKEEK